jgi:hypothetical protein
MLTPKDIRTRYDVLTKLIQLYQDEKDALEILISVYNNTDYVDVHDFACLIEPPPSPPLTIPHLNTTPARKLLHYCRTTKTKQDTVHIIKSATFAKTLGMGVNKLSEIVNQFLEQGLLTPEPHIGKGYYIFKEESNDYR